MNVVETVAEGETAATHAQMNPIQCVVRPTHSNSPAPSAPSTPPPMLLQPVAASMPASPNSLTKIQPSKITLIASIQSGKFDDPLVFLETNANSRPSTPTQSKPGVVNITQTEKEQIAMQWLRATFEPVVGAPSIEQNVLYRQYTAGCSRNGPKQVLGIVQFFSCVRYTLATINFYCINSRLDWRHLSLD